MAIFLHKRSDPSILSIFVRFGPLFFIMIFFQSKPLLSMCSAPLRFFFSQVERNRGWKFIPRSANRCKLVRPSTFNAEWRRAYHRPPLRGPERMVDGCDPMWMWSIERMSFPSPMFRGADSGQYTCTAANKHGTATATVYLSIDGEPRATGTLSLEGSGMKFFHFFSFPCQILFIFHFSTK